MKWANQIRLLIASLLVVGVVVGPVRPQQGPRVASQAKISERQIQLETKTGKIAAVQRKEDDMRFEMLVGDVVEWIKVLRKDSRFSRVGVVGHSEGSLVGMLAAKQGGADAFVALAGCGRRASEVLRWQLGKN